MRSWPGENRVPRCSAGGRLGWHGGGDGGADPGAGLGRRWDVALSFAGAQRDYVERVAAALKARGVRCFYDADRQVRLWGTHLAQELPRIYERESAVVVVVFVSADYAGGTGPGSSAAPRSAGPCVRLWGVRTRLVPATCVDWWLMVIRNDDHPCPSVCST